jgi:hypothetical protein
MLLIIMELNEHKNIIEKALNETISDFTVVVTSVDLSESKWSRSGNLRINCDIYRKH